MNQSKSDKNFTKVEGKSNGNSIFGTWQAVVSHGSLSIPSPMLVGVGGLLGVSETPNTEYETVVPCMCVCRLCYHTHTSNSFIKGKKEFGLGCIS